MEKSITQSAAELSKTAPRITIKMIPKDRIGELIGPGGKISALSLNKVKLTSTLTMMKGYYF